MENAVSLNRILRLPKVREKVGLGTDAIYRLARLNQFPKPIKLGSRASGWVEREIDEWIEARAAARAAADQSTAA